MGAAIDLAGRRFGRLVVTNKSDKRQGGAICWHCQCDCGTMVCVKSGSLLKGATRSCGCISKTRIRRIDLSGLKFNRLTVCSYQKTINGCAYWLCKCNCGKYTSVRGEALRSESVKSCGCLRVDRNKELYGANLVGKRFGRWMVVSQYNIGPRKGVHWNCVCDCGNRSVKSSGSLLSGRTRSCGCYNREASRQRNIDSTENLVGRRFGRLVVVSQSGRSPDGQRIQWLCKCDCGNTTTVARTPLRLGQTKSCGCYGTAVRMARHTSLLPEEIPIELAIAQMKLYGLKKLITTQKESQ